MARRKYVDEGELEELGTEKGADTQTSIYTLNIY